MEMRQNKSAVIPETEKSEVGIFHARPIQTVEISKELRDWYRSECDKERMEIHSEGFSEYELDQILIGLGGDGLFALALAHNILRQRRKMEARDN